MSTDEHASMDSLSGDENTLDTERPVVSHRGAILGILIAAIVVAEVSKDVIFSTDRGDWRPAWEFLYYGVMACLPFLLARMAPQAAGFDARWLPSSRRHWAWFFGMLFLLIVLKALVAALAATFVGRPSPGPSFGPVTPLGIVFRGIAIVFVAPIAEEIFFRGYILEQLRKLTRSSIALLIQALCFGLFHLYTWGLFTSLAAVNSVDAFFFGLMLGAWRIKFRSLVPLILAHALVNTIVIVPLKTQYDQAVYRSHPHYTISRETTYITGPLRKDGFVNYVAALDQRFSEGVTPENNAAVLFWKAVGPEEIIPEYRETYFQMLGIPPLPEKGDYFVDLEKYVNRQKDGAKSDGAKSEPETKVDAYALLAPALNRPWSKDEFPVLAAWLATNERSMALLVEASKRPRRYDPLVCGERTPLIAVFQPFISVFYHAGNVTSALVARAMLRLNEGKVEEAWDDLLTCHRLVRLVGQGPTEIDATVAQSRDGTACDGDQAFLQHTLLTAAQVAEMRDDLDRLPPMPKMADTFDIAERFAYLNDVSDSSRHGAASLAGFDRAAELENLRGSKELKDTIKRLIHYSAGTAIDWDLILRMGNAWFDRIADAYRKPTRAEQREALSKLDEDLATLKKTAEDATSLDKLMLDNPSQALSERLGQVILIVFSPSIMLEVNLDDRATMTFELTKLAFALAAYHADQGSYPANLGDLTPNYVAEVPKDIFNDSELHYRLEGDGYVLYSVGFNGKDDGAKRYDDRKKEYDDWDDIVVRVPVPEQR